MEAVRKVADKIRSGAGNKEEAGKILAKMPPQDSSVCLLYTSDAADELPCVDLGGRRILHTQKEREH